MPDVGALRTLMLPKTVSLATITLTLDDDLRVQSQSSSSASISAEVQFGSAEDGETTYYSRQKITGDAELYTAPDVIGDLGSPTTKYQVTYDGKTYAVEKQLDSILAHDRTELVDVFSMVLVKK